MNSNNEPFMDGIARHSSYRIEHTGNRLVWVTREGTFQIHDHRGAVI
jgi:hypothetical protein